MWFLGGTGQVGVTHTSSSVQGWAGSICDCLKAEDTVLDAGRILELVHVLHSWLCDLCRMQRCLSPGVL